MINAIIKGIFKIITSFFSILMMPVVNYILRLFPDLSTAFSYIATYLNYGLPYVRSIMSLMLIPEGLVIFFFDYLIVCSTIYYGILAYKFAINIYNKYKL